MYYAIKNRNIHSAYPNVTAVFPVVNMFDKMTGLDYSAIEINSLQELFSLQSLAASTNEYFTGIYISGNTIEFKEGE
jgi:hypothetical protein